MGKITGVNGQVIKWCRLLNNMSIDYVAGVVNQKPENIKAWEEGIDFPTYTQIEKLGTLYKKPIAVFFFPDIPQISSPKSSFRTLPEYMYDSLSHKLIKIINEARAMQINLFELNDGINPAPILLTDLVMPDDTDIAAKELRNIFNIRVEKQKRIKEDDDALEMWRNLFLEHGIYVFKEAFEDDSISGFCISDDKFPVIYLNNSMSFTRQIFTLFHEFYHLISNTSGIDKVEDDFLQLLSEEHRKIEMACNMFSGDFLVPNESFDKDISHNMINEDLINSLAKQYNVSREVIARKLLDRRLITKEDYENKRLEYLNDYYRSKHKKKNNKGSGNYYNTKVSYLGTGYLHLVYNNYRKQKIDLFQLSDYTRTRIEHLPKLEAAWGWRVGSW